MEDTFTCGICFDDLSIEDVSIIGCSHLYCRLCMGTYLKTEIELRKTTILCPEPECHFIFEENDIEMYITPEVMRIFLSNSLEKAISDSNKIFRCPKNDCLGVAEVNSRYFECPICQYEMCTKCKNDYHEKKECPLKEDLELEKLAKEKKYKKCPRCQIFVERISGCNHVKCRCGMHFCYLCGKDIRKEMYRHFNKDHVMFSKKHHPNNAIARNQRPLGFQRIAQNIIRERRRNNTPEEVIRILNNMIDRPRRRECQVKLIKGPNKGKLCGRVVTGDRRVCRAHKPEDLNRK